jgi:hypothetical protein
MTRVPGQSINFGLGSGGFRVVLLSTTKEEDKRPTPPVVHQPGQANYASANSTLALQGQEGISIRGELSGM